MRALSFARPLPSSRITAGLVDLAIAKRDPGVKPALELRVWSR